MQAQAEGATVTRPTHTNAKTEWAETYGRSALPALISQQAKQLQTLLDQKSKEQSIRAKYFAFHRTVQETAATNVAVAETKAAEEAVASRPLSNYEIKEPWHLK